MRVAVLFDNFGPYHYARLNAAAAILSVTGIETVERSHDYEWRCDAVAEFQHTTLFSESSGQGAFDLSGRLAKTLDDSHPEAVAIPGWSAKAAFAALTWCSDSGTPVILMSESGPDDEPRVAWRELAKRRIVSLCSVALVGGQRHVDYLVQLGMPRERIFTGYDAVENDHFARGAKEVRSKKDELRKKYELPENYFLASARFIEKKNLAGLIRAYAAYRERSSPVTSHSSPWSLVLLGDGPLKSDLRHLISDLGLKDFVLLPGFKQYDELPVYYGLAKAFVHASTTEQWGLVVNEAMASGLPVIVSNRCGCAPELVHGNVNGFTFDPANQEQITENLLSMSALSDAEREAFGEVSSRIVAGHDVDRFATGLESAAELATSLPCKRAGLVDRALLRGLMWR